LPNRRVKSWRGDDEGINIQKETSKRIRVGIVLIFYLE